MSSAESIDTAIRVVVAPSQSSYFAGEPFAVSITFTNTRSPDAPAVARALSHTHKRGAHSISSAPLARPPTSPGQARSAGPAPPPRAQPNFARRGLVGCESDASEDQPPDARRRNGVKSLSVSIPPGELDAQLTPSPSTPHTPRTAVPPRTPNSPRISSPLARSNPFPIRPGHPHARKDSAADLGALNGNGNASLSTTPSLPPTPGLPALPQTPNTSTFSLSLDPISESHSPNSPNSHAPLPAPTPSSPAHAYPPRTGPARRPSSLGLGLSPALAPLPPAPRTAFPVPARNTELVLYAYAQLVGALAISPPEGAPSSADQSRTLNALRGALASRGAMGGGSMDIASSFSTQRRRPHARSNSLLGMFSPSALLGGSAPPSPGLGGHRRGGSVVQKQNGEAPIGLGLLDGAGAGEVDPETPLPTFETQQAMLGVDLSLAPGESRTYVYTLALPANLPPTFKGRALQFSYQLIVGTCRAGTGGAGAAGSGSNSRIMKVPIRIYNNVAVGRAPRPYDLLWPVAKRRKGAVADGARVTEKFGEGAGALEKREGLDSLASVRSYARRLAEATLAPGPAVKLPPNVLSPTVGIGEEGIEGEGEGEGQGGLSGCREAVEILTRNPKKVSYDVNKDGVKVAVLTFTKSAYRLGETILGVVELNQRGGRARVLKLSATLEAHESLPSALAPALPARHARRVHASWHASFVQAALRTTFALDIPSDAAPAFEVEVGGEGNKGLGGLEWKVRMYLLVAVAKGKGREEVRVKQLVRDGARGEWGSSWRAAGDVAPMERAEKEEGAGGARVGWGAWAASLLGGAEEERYHDGDEDEEVEEDKEEEEGWVGMGVETVECEVPVRVWPGNTAYKAMEVVFDV